MAEEEITCHPTTEGLGAGHGRARSRFQQLHTQAESGKPQVLRQPGLLTLCASDLLKKKKSQHCGLLEIIVKCLMISRLCRVQTDV